MLKQVVCMHGRRMHECDVVLATYEQIRKELSAKQRCARAVLRCVLPRHMSALWRPERPSALPYEASCKPVNDTALHWCK